MGNGTEFIVAADQWSEKGNEDRRRWFGLINDIDTCKGGETKIHVFTRGYQMADLTDQRSEQREVQEESGVGVLDDDGLGTG